MGVINHVIPNWILCHAWIIFWLVLWTIAFLSCMGVGIVCQPNTCRSDMPLLKSSCDKPVLQAVATPSNVALSKHQIYALKLVLCLMSRLLGAFCLGLDVVGKCAALPCTLIWPKVKNIWSATWRLNRAAEVRTWSAYFWNKGLVWFTTYFLR